MLQTLIIKFRVTKNRKLIKKTLISFLNLPLPTLIIQSSHSKNIKRESKLRMNTYIHTDEADKRASFIFNFSVSGLDLFDHLNPNSFS